MSWLTSLISGGASLIGNLFNQSNQQDINQQNYWAQIQQNLANQNAAAALQDKQIAHVQDINRQNLAAQEMANFRNIDLARENRDLAILQADKYALMAQQDKAHDRALQQDFAKMGIQWRVQDALNAGIHPIHALSGGGAAYSPSAISLTAPQFSSPQVQASQGQAASLGSAPMGAAARAVAGNSFSNMGQDISRALLATASGVQRDTAFVQAQQDLTLQNLTLRNDLLASQIGRLKSGQVGPSMPVADSLPSSVPQADKYEERERLSLGGGQAVTDPQVVSMQSYSNRYGDEGFPQWIYAPYILWRDLVHQFGQAEQRNMANPFHSEKPSWQQSGREWFYRKDQQYQRGTAN